jgi:cystathionine beta-lyase/cystathionine gamma-synthase
MYIREGNPTQTRLETALATVEGGEAALVFASGIAAGAAYLQALPAGSHAIFHRKYLGAHSDVQGGALIFRKREHAFIEHRASSEGPSTTTPDNLLRVSVGLEDPEDLIQDLSQALA